MKNRRNYYRLLQVQPDAPAEVIRASYRTLMLALKQHPDLGGSTDEASLLNEAYEVLSHPQRRSAYDRQLSVQFKRPARAERPSQPPQARHSCPICGQESAKKPQPGDRCNSCHSPLQSTKMTERMSQRAVARIQVNRKIFYYSSWPGEAREARMVDFSPKGMCFLTPETLSPRALLKIISPHFQASAQVTHLHQETVDGKKLYSVGVSFLAIRFEENKGFMLHACA